MIEGKVLFDRCNRMIIVFAESEALLNIYLITDVPIIRFPHVVQTLGARSTQADDNDSCDDNEACRNERFPGSPPECVLTSKTDFCRLKAQTMTLTLQETRSLNQQQRRAFDVVS